MIDGKIKDEILADNVWSIELQNSIDETVAFPDVPAAAKAVVIDLGNATYINSYGIRNWVKWAEELTQKVPGQKIEIAKMPLSFIRAFSLIKEVLPPKVKIQSFYANYFCSECDEELAILVENLANVKVPEGNCPKCNHPLELELPIELYKSLLLKQ